MFCLVYEKMHQWKRELGTWLLGFWVSLFFFFFLLYFLICFFTTKLIIMWALRYIELFEVDFGFCCSLFEFLVVTSWFKKWEIHAKYKSSFFDSLDWFTSGRSQVISVYMSLTWIFAELISGLIWFFYLFFSRLFWHKIFYEKCFF
jgi:hypothetical protein